MNKNEHGMYEIVCPYCGSRDEYYATSSGFDNCTNCIKRIEVPKKKETGGPAFPLNNEAQNTSYGGMTLRDYFAAKVMGSLFVVDEYPETMNFEAIAKISYSQADAMLAEREK